MRAAVIVVLCVVLTACGAAAVPKLQHTKATKPPNTPICAFYGTTLTVGILATSLHDPSVTIARLRPRWPKVRQAAELGAGVHWRGPSAPATGAAYARFLGDVRRAGTAVDGGDLPGFQAAMRAAKTHLVALSALAKRSHLTCKVVSADGSTMTFGA